MKMQSFVFLLFMGIALLTGTGCDKEEIGSVKFSNTSTNPYQLIINGESRGEFSGGSWRIFELKAGYYELRAEQVSGFILFPTVKTGEIWVKDGDYLEWSFP
ncbi:MAG TPA: hypothetical protein PLL53_15170 [Saprospiraceae bacterium]|jgi:hypothetical protein|nr:hypothetical protein [Saprospiraceae bacterium]